jgi:hypothetical protein
MPPVLQRADFRQTQRPLDEARNTKKYLSKDSHISGENLNSGPPEYKSELPITQ